MVSGAPAIDHRLWLKCCAAYAKLPEIAKAVRKLQSGSESFLGTIPDPVNLAFRIPESLNCFASPRSCAAAAPELTVISADITGSHARRQLRTIRARLHIGDAIRLGDDQET